MLMLVQTGNAELGRAVRAATFHGLSPTARSESQLARDGPRLLLFTHRILHALLAITGRL